MGARNIAYGPLGIGTNQNLTNATSESMPSPSEMAEAAAIAAGALLTTDTQWTPNLAATGLHYSVAVDPKRVTGANSFASPNSNGVAVLTVGSQTNSPKGH